MLKKLVAIIALTITCASPAFALRVGLDPTIKPFIYQDAQNNLRGFDIDMANIICRELNDPCEFYPMEWAGLLPALQSGKIDVIISGMAITTERAKVVDFSIPYYQTVSQMIALDPNVVVKKVGAGLGTNEQAALEAEGKYQVVPYENLSVGMLDLINGRIDAYANTKPEITEQIKDLKGRDLQGRTFVFIGEPLTDPEFFGPGIGMALRKNDDRLAKIDKVILDIRKSKEWQETANKYFTDDIWAYPKDENGNVIE